MLYHHISESERILIDFMFNEQKKSITEIAKFLNRDKSSVSRELNRNKNKEYHYNCKFANLKAKERQWHKHSMHFLKYRRFIEEFLKIYDKKYCGVETSRSIIKNKFGDEFKIPSVKQIYNWINSNAWTIKHVDLLRNQYKKGNKREIDVFTSLKDKFVLPIWARSKCADERKEYGHWEADLIVSKRERGNDHLLTFVERKSRIGYIVRVKSKKCFEINLAIHHLVKSENLLVKSIAIDNGIEFARMGFLGKWLKCKIYYCQPYASYQRGSNENFNSLVRRALEKGTNFSLITDKEIKQIQDSINNMPRKIHGWKPSNEMINEIKIKKNLN